MHWTLLALIEICIGCIVLNAVQWILTGQVRLSGLLICGAWAIQQSYWAAIGHDSVAIFLACDAIILAYFWFRKTANTMADWMAATCVVATVPIYMLADYWGQSDTSWWANWMLVAAAMIFSLPYAKGQKIGGAVTHGSLRCWQEEWQHGDA